MNDDLISRSALLDILLLLAKYQPEYKTSTILGVCETIKTQPAVDAEPVRHGRWEEPYPYDPYDCYKCSCCGVKYDLTWNYCPNCGAKMDAEVRE